MKATKRTFGAALASGALLVSVGAAPASAGSGGNVNSVKYWERETGLNCVKYEYDYVTWDFKYMVATGYYDLVVIKGGSVNGGQVVYEGVEPGDILAAPLNAGGQQANISYAIKCT